MNAFEFCAEHHNELPSGKISFNKRQVAKFLKNYTFAQYDDFSKNQIEGIKNWMIDLSNSYIRAVVVDDFKSDTLSGKMEIPKHIYS